MNTEILKKLGMSDADIQTVVTEHEAMIDAERIKLKEQFDKDLEQLQETTATIIEEEVAAIHAEVEQELTEARTLDVRYATRLVEAEDEMREKMDAEYKLKLVEAVEELETEMSESVTLIRQNKQVMNIIGALNENASLFGVVSNEDTNALSESEREELTTLRRENKLNELTEGLDDKAARTAKTLLVDVPFEKLTERFESYKAMIIESALAEPQSKPLNESTNVQPDGEIVDENLDADKEGDGKAEPVKENAEEKPAPVLSESTLARIRRQAGITNN